MQFYCKSDFEQRSLFMSLLFHVHHHRLAFAVCTVCFVYNVFLCIDFDLSIWFDERPFSYSARVLIFNCHTFYVAIKFHCHILDRLDFGSHPFEEYSLVFLRHVVCCFIVSYNVDNRRSKSLCTRIQNAQNLKTNDRQRYRKENE